MLRAVQKVALEDGAILSPRDEHELRVHVVQAGMCRSDVSSKYVLACCCALSVCITSIR